MMRRSLLAFAIALLIAGCAIRTIPLAYAPEASRRSAGQHDYDSAVKAVALVMVEDMRLPPLDSVLHVYPHIGSYEMGLRMELDDRPNAAARSVSFATASCTKRKILADGERLAKISWPDRVRILAHEMIHLEEFMLADWACWMPHYWLMEGFAEWGAFTIIDRLGLEKFANSIDASKQGVRLPNGRTLPLLSRLVSEAEWSAAEMNVGRQAVYSQSFLAVDFLIQRNSLAAVVDYFARFKDSAVRNDNFAAVFGEDVEEFAAEFEQHLKTLFMQEG